METKRNQNSAFKIWDPHMSKFESFKERPSSQHLCVVSDSVLAVCELDKCGPLNGYTRYGTWHGCSMPQICH